MTEFKLELGSKVKCRITGFKGTITSRSEHINGCNRYFVAPPVDKDGKLPDGYWFDEMDLEITEKKKSKNKTRDLGGPVSKIK